jgi:mRNA-degrading endonuclease toxin of MazEF toxin-antitoxin module
VLVVQADSFNRSRIQTAIAAVITSNLELADVPGNVLAPARSAGLPRDSVVNVSQLLTLDRSFLTERAGTLPPGGIGYAPGVPAPHVGIRNEMTSPRCAIPYARDTSVRTVHSNK